MKNKTSILLFMSFLFITMVSLASASVEIQNCTTLNIPSETYLLTQDVSTTGTCFTIGADNITLDGQGHNIGYAQSSSGRGIFNNGFERVTIKDATIVQEGVSSSSYGIWFRNGANNGRVENVNVTTYGNSAYGIYLDDSSNNIITTPAVTTSGIDGRGIYLSFSSNSNTITTPTVTTSGDYGYGIMLLISSNSNTITTPTVTTSGSSGFGLFISSSNSNTITTPTVTTSGDYGRGIYLDSSSENVINNGGISANAASGIFIGGVTADYNNLTNMSFLGTNTSFYDLEVSVNIDGTYLIDMADISGYSFWSSGNIVNFKDSQYGEIKFLEAISGTGTSLSNDIRITHNSAIIDSSENPGLDKSSEITLYDLATLNFTNPIILRNGLPCPQSICTPITPLNADTVIFNVTNSGNYAVGEADTNPPEVSIWFPKPWATYTSDDLPLNFMVVLNEEGGNVQYTLDRGATNTTMNTTDGLTYTYSLSSLATGKYAFQVYATDIAGNINNTESVKFKFINNISMLQSATII